MSHRPHCVLEVRPDKMARVCAWCPDKKQGDEWCADRGYEVTHGLCPKCELQQQIEIDAEITKKKSHV